MDYLISRNIHMKNARTVPPSVEKLEKFLPKLRDKSSFMRCICKVSKKPWVQGAEKCVTLDTRNTADM